MPMKNELAGDIGLAAGKSQYDAQCKRILANKIILAWILKYTVKEFEKMSIRQIKQCIGNDIMISRVRGDPGKTNIHEEPEKIIGESGEDKVPGEGEVYFDIRFSVYLPRKREKVKMIVNVEAQKDFHPGYAVPSRSVFSCSDLSESSITEREQAYRDAEYTAFVGDESRAEDPGIGRKLSYTYDSENGKGAESDVQPK